MSDREELIALRRLAELEAKAGNGVASTASEKPAVAPVLSPKNQSLSDKLFGVDPKSTEPTFAENAATWIANKTGNPNGFDDATVDNANNFAAGATSTNRGIGNLIAGKGAFQPPVSPTGNPTDKDSGRYLAGAIGDPTSWAAASGLTKLPMVGKSLQMLPISGRDKVAKALQNMVAGGAIGGTLGGLSEDSTVAEGALTGAVAGGILPSAVALSKNYIAEPVKNLASAIGSSFNNKAGIERLAKDAISKNAGQSREQIINAIAENRQKALANVGVDKIDGYRPTVAEVIANEQIGKSGQFGGAAVRLQRDLTGAQGIEDVLTGTNRANKVALAEHGAKVNSVTTPMRESALAASNVRGGVDVNKLVGSIDQTLNDPKISNLAKSTLNSVKQEILDKAGVNGKVNADALYTTRKELNNTIKRFSGETQNWDKKVTGKLERDIQKHIDTAIESSGGEGWTGYLKTHSSGMQKVSEAMAAMDEAKKIGASVKSSIANNLTSGELPKPPTLLSRPMMIVNYGLKVLSQDANTPVAKEVASALQDPEKYAAYLKLPTSSPLRIQMDKIIKQATLIGAVKMRENTQGE